MDSVYSGKLIKSDITAEMLRELSKMGEGGGWVPIYQYLLALSEEEEKK